MLLKLFLVGVVAWVCLRTSQCTPCHRRSRSRVEVLAKRKANQPVAEADWQRIFQSEGYVRLKKRETSRRLTQINAAISRQPDVALPILKAVFSYDSAAGLRAVKVLVRAINADRVPTDVELNRKYAPQFDAVMIKGTGHYPMMEDPARFNQMLAEILRNLPRK